MFIFFLETTIEFRPVGWMANTCSCCNKIRALKVEEIMEVKKIWTITYQTKGVGTRFTCDFCANDSAVAGLDPAGLDTRKKWEPADGLQSLFDETLPGETAPDEASIALGENDLEAIFTSVFLRSKERAASGGLVGCVLGTLVGLALSAAFVFGLQLYDLPAAICWGVGSLGGIIVGTLWDRKLALRRHLLNEFQTMMDKHRLSPYALVDFARHSATSFGDTVASVLVQLNDKTSVRTAAA